MFGNGHTAREIIDSFDCAKRLYETTKPIRGRKEDIRPIGLRRRDDHYFDAYSFEREGAPHETINCVGLCLGSTEVVTYRDDGIVGINMGRWDTISTAEFINSYTNMECVKRHNRLWITGAGDIKYPLEGDDTLYLYRGNPVKTNDHWSPDRAESDDGSDYKGTYFTDVPVKIYRDTVDRGRMRQLRDRLKPFLTYLRSMHKMSGGAPVSEKFYEKYAGKYVRNSNPPLEAIQLSMQRYWGLDGYTKNFENEIGDEGEYLASVGFYDYIDKIKDNPTNYNRLIALLCHLFNQARDSQGGYFSLFNISQRGHFTFEDIADYTVKVLSDGGYKKSALFEPSRKYYTKVNSVSYE